MVTDNLTARIEALEAKGYELGKYKSVAKFPHMTTSLNILNDRGVQALKDGAEELLTALEQAEARNAATIETLNVCQAALGQQAGQTDMTRAIGAARLKLAERRIAALGKDNDRLLLEDMSRYGRLLARAEQAEAALAEMKAAGQVHPDQIRDLFVFCGRSTDDPLIQKYLTDAAFHAAVYTAANEHGLREQTEAALAAERALGVMFKESIRRNVRRVEELEAALAAEREKQARRLHDPKKGEWKRKYFQARADLDAEREKRCATCGRYDWDVLVQQWACQILEAADDPDGFGCTEWQPRNPVPNAAQPGDERDAEGTGEAADV